jgi:hypothetical protein
VSSPLQQPDRRWPRLKHFFKCEWCGGYFDLRDPGAVLDRLS